MSAVLIEGGGARELRFEDYWLDVGTIGAYHRAHMDLLGPRLDAPDGPILTVGAQRAPAAISGGSHAA